MAIIASKRLAAAALAAAAVFLSMSATAVAHQQKVAITSVLFNPRTGMLEVAHKLFVHDAEHAAAELWRGVDLLSREEDRKKFADYVRARFRLADESGEEIKLAPVGYEIDGDYFWVYHEALAPDGVASLTVDDKILRDFWRDQTNTVTVERNDFRKSVIFVAADGPKQIEVRDAPARDLQIDKTP